METFSFGVSAPVLETIVYKNLVTNFDSGNEKRRNRWFSPKRKFKVALSGNSETAMNAAWAFYVARSGKFETFLFENPAESPAVRVYIGTGNGSNKYFFIPSIPVYSQATTTVYVANVSVTFTVTLSTGFLALTAAPAVGKIVTASYRCFRTVRFNDDDLTRELFAYKLLNADLELVEVLP